MCKSIIKCFTIVFLISMTSNLRAENNYRCPEHNLNMWVCAMEEAQPGQFIDQKDGTVINANAKLMWIKNANKFRFRNLSFEQAMSSVERYEFSNYNDWRLPTKDELVQHFRYLGGK